MLPKQNRLSSDYDIEKAYKTRIQAKTTHFKIYFSQNEHSDFKLLVIVSKKIYKKANKRNRLKRKVYSLFDDLHFRERLPPSVSCIVQVQNKALLNEDNSQIWKELLPKLSLLYLKLSKTH